VNEEKSMRIVLSIPACYLSGVSIVAFACSAAFACPAVALTAPAPAADSSVIGTAGAAAASEQSSAEERDGQHDFDFLLGTWKVHLRQMTNPLAGSPHWVEMDGINTTKTIWNGKANYDEVVFDAPSGHKESMTLRLYNPQTHQWNLWWASRKDGAMQAPPMAGAFKDGRGEFYDGEMFHDKAIYVRDVWSEITPTSAHFEQSFSADGGKTWEANWIATLTRTGS
jgi:hypothetical protein